MGKQPVVARQDTRYEPYSKASLARRRRGSPPPGGWGILAGSRQAQLTGDICNLLDDLDKRYGGRDLRELFRDHANPPGALGQAIKTWISYDEIQGSRQPEPTDILDARHVSPPRQYSEHPDVAAAGRNYLQHNCTPPGERLFADPPNSPCQHTVPTSKSIPYSHPESAASPRGISSIYRPSFIHKAGDLWEDIQPQGEEHDYWGEPPLPLAVSRPPEGPLYTSPHHSPTSGTRPDPPVADAPPLGSLRVLRGVVAPPLVSLPPLKPSAFHGGSNWSDKPLTNSHNEQDYVSPRNSEESYHAAFWETAGWTPEDGYQGFSLDGPRILPSLKGKARARLRDPNEGGETPEEQDSSGPPQPGNLPYGIPVLANTKLQVDVQPAFKIDPQDEDFTMITWHQEDRLAGDKEPEYEQHPAQPQPQPQPRRSARIKAMHTAALIKAKAPTKSTGRKRAVRKK